MKSKGQIDMFGLVIIIILLVVIGLFSLFFIGRGDTSSNNVYYSLKAENFANAIAKSSFENSNVESLILSCCSGKNEDCDSLLNFVDEEFSKLDLVGNEESKFELECRYNDEVYSTGNCDVGIASESIILQSGDSIKAFLCRKA